MKNEFFSIIHSIYTKLEPLFSKFLTETSQLKTQDSVSDKKEEILSLMQEHNLALISSNSSKKKLKKIGIEPKRLIITGGPLTVEDYELINPNLTYDAIHGIKSKCKRLSKQIKNVNWKDKDLIFIFERENVTDKLILNRLDEISKMIGKKPILIELVTWNELDK